VPVRAQRWLVLMLYIALGGICVYAWYTRYFLWLDCFNELGRCYDPDGSQQVYTTSAQMWMLPALVCLGLGIQTVRQLLRWSQTGPKGPSHRP
jgi:hypothetical protein